jgi:hypothetical protein
MVLVDTLFYKKDQETLSGFAVYLYKISSFKISLFFVNSIFILAFLIHYGKFGSKSFFFFFKHLWLLCFCLPLTIFLSSSPGLLLCYISLHKLTYSLQCTISFQLLLLSSLLVIQILLKNSFFKILWVFMH